MSLCTIPGNPDIAGIGVRIAIYIQNLLCFAPALWALWDGEVTQEELDSAETQTTTNLVLAFAILISSIVQALTLGLSNYHANIVLSMSWMNNTNAFIYFLLYIHHKRHLVRPDWASWYAHVRGKFDFVLPCCGTDSASDQSSEVGIPGHKENGSTEALDSRGRHSAKVLVKRFVILLGSLHLSLMAALGIWLWINLFSFGNRESVDPNNCAATSAFIAIVGQAVPMGAKALRICSLVLYAIFLIPGFNLVLPVALFLSLNFWCQRRTYVGDNSNESRGKRWTALPAFIGLILLLGINIIFIVDIEATLLRNEDLQGGEEDKWGFGQILAILLVLLPLRDLIETLLARRMKRFEKKRRLETAAELTGALRSKEFDAVVRAIERGADLNKVLDVEEKGGTSEWLLGSAVSKGHYDIVAVLVKRPTTNVNFADADGRTALDLVCRSGEVGPGHLEILELLLQRDNIDTNGVNSEGRTLLMDACSQGDEPTIKLLLNHPKTNPNQVEGGHTALSLVSRTGHTSIIRLLLNHADTDINLVVDRRTTALMEACRGGHEDAVTELLTSSSAMVNLQMEDGSTALFTALDGRHEAVAALLLEHPDVDTHLVNDKGQTPLMISCLYGAEQSTKLVLEKHSPDVNLRDKDGSTALTLALAGREGHDAVAVLLLQHPDIDVNITDEHGQTPLMMACRGGAEQSAKLLLERHSPSLNLQDQDGNTALFLALAHKHDAVAARLLQHPDIDAQTIDRLGENVLMTACRKGAEQSTKVLLARHSHNINSYNKSGYSALTLALESGNDVVVACLLAQPDIDINATSKWGKTPLMVACERGTREAVNFFLERDPSNLNLQDFHGMTALMYAALMGRQEIVATLLCLPDIRLDLKIYHNERTAAQLCERIYPKVYQLISAHEVATQRQSGARPEPTLHSTSQSHNDFSS